MLELTLAQDLRGIESLRGNHRMVVNRLKSLYKFLLYSYVFHLYWTVGWSHQKVFNCSIS